MNNTNTPAFASFRDAILSMYEIGESPEQTVFIYAKRLMISLREGIISSKEYELLSGTLFHYCKREKISTSIEIDGKVIFDLF